MCFSPLFAFILLCLFDVITETFELRGGLASPVNKCGHVSSALTTASARVSVTHICPQPPLGLL